MVPEYITPQAVIVDYVGTLTTKADEKTHTLRPEAEKILSLLKGRYKLAIISKSRNPQIRMHELTKSPLASYADYLTACKEKTDEVVEETLRALGVTGPACWAVDDRVRNFPPFKRAGCRTIWLQKGFYASEEPQDEREEPEIRILELSNLIGILLQ